MKHFIFLFVSVLLIPLSVDAATFSVSPATGSFTVGQRVVVSVSVSSDIPMNAASGVLSFPTDLMSVESVTKGSVLNFWVTEPAYSNTSGKITFEGVSLSGFQGSNGSVVTIALRAKKAGQGTIAFDSGQILANDGQGTDITTGMRSGTYSFAVGTAPTIPQKPEPEPVAEEKPVVNPPSAPTIRFGALDEYDAVLGVSEHPKADVVLTFISVSGSKVYITGTADSEGAFALLVPTALKNGPYAVTAIMILEGELQTEVSEPLSVEVGMIAGFLTWEYAAYASFALLLLSVGSVAVLLRQGSFGNSYKISAKVQKEVGEARDALHRSFSLLRRDVADRTLEEARKAPDGEKTATLAMRRDLDDAERMIEKELHDIDTLSSGKS